MRNLRFTHIAVAFLLVLGCAAFLLLLCCYPNHYPNPVNIGVYVCISFGTPFLFILLCWRRKTLRWISLLLGIFLVVIAVLLYGNKIVFTDTAYENYPQEKAKNPVVASSFLPSEEELNLAHDVQYLHKWSLGGDKFIWLTGSFSESEYNNITEQIERNVAQCLSKPGAPSWYREGEDVSFRSAVYKCVEFSHDNALYIMAYSTDESSCRISYLFFSCDEISFMSAYDAMKYCCS